MSDGIPQTWTSAKLGELITEASYGSSAKTNGDATGIPVLRMGNIVSGKLDFSQLKYLPIDHDEFPDLLLSTGDVLFNRTNSAELVGKTAVYRGTPAPCSFASYLIRFRLTGVLPDWVSLYLNSPFGRACINEVVSQQAGQANVNGTKLKGFTIPLPPLAEQKRIVAKIEELFSELEAGEESLRVARRQLGVYRQSLLKQAFEGKLTEKWRTQNPAKLESPAQLLARIQAEHSAVPEKRRRKWLPQSEEDESPSSELPFGWLPLPLGNVCDLENGDRGPNYPNRSEYVSTGVAWINAGHIEGDGTLSRENMYFITPEKFESLRSGKIRRGDLVYCLRGTLGKVASVDPFTEGAVASSLAIVRPMPYCLGRYLLLYFMSPLGAQQIKRFDNGSAQPNLSANNVRLYAVPLCSLPEQQEIVRLLDAQFEVIERNEREIDAALKRSEALRQAILKKAFTGRLVPQDPSDEPASHLLARLRAERVSTSTSKLKPVLSS